MPEKPAIKEDQLWATAYAMAVEGWVRKALHHGQSVSGWARDATAVTYRSLDDHATAVAELTLTAFKSSR